MFVPMQLFHKIWLGMTSGGYHGTLRWCLHSHVTAPLHDYTIT